MDTIDQNLARIRRVVDSAILRSATAEKPTLTQALSPSQPSGSGGTPSRLQQVQTHVAPPRERATHRSHIPELADQPTDATPEPTSLHRRMWAWIKRVAFIKGRLKGNAD